jgi:hypothetical protein
MFWEFWRRQESLALAGFQISLSPNSLPSHYTDYAVLAPIYVGVHTHATSGSRRQASSRLLTF